MSIEELNEYNENINKYFEENADRIACVLAYSVPGRFKPMVITYHKMFNDEIVRKYNANVFYANGLAGNEDLLITYFILVKEEQKGDPEAVNADCKMYVNKFADYNKDVTGGVAARFYDLGSKEKIEEFRQGEKDSLKDISFFNS
jgi:hypothetical protein